MEKNRQDHTHMIKRFIGFPKRSQRPSSKSRREVHQRPFETLESRRLLAYSADFDAATGVLTFTGNGADSGETVRLAMQGGTATETLSATWNDDISGQTTQSFSGVTTVFVQNVVDDGDSLEVQGLPAASIALATDKTLEYDAFLPICPTNISNLTLDAGGGADAGAVTLAGQVSGAVVVRNAGAVTVGAGSAFNVGSLSVTGNSIDIADQLVAAGNVILSATTGALTASGPASVIEASTATVSAATGINLFTQVTNISASVTGTGDIQITETDGLHVVTASTTDGGISIESQTGDIAVDGAVTAATGLTVADNSVTLAAKTGAISGSGLITGALIDVSAGGNATFRTAAVSLQAVVTGTLSVTETDALQIGALGITAGGRVSLTTGSNTSRPGSLTGTFTVSEHGAVHDVATGGHLSDLAAQ